MSLARQIERARLVAEAEKKPAKKPQPKVTVAGQPGVEVSVDQRLVKAAKEAQAIAEAPADLTPAEGAVWNLLTDTPKAERLELARAILRALKATQMREYRQRKGAKP